MHDATGAPTLAIGPHVGNLCVDPDDEGEEAIDRNFAPTRRVTDGEVAVDTGEFTLTVVSTPGHTSNHMCVALAQERALFSGDHVMGWSTTVVSPPDGDMETYMESLRKLQRRNDDILWPTHGGPITNAQAYLAQYPQHRLDREAQILQCLADSVTTIAGMVATMYSDVRVELHRRWSQRVITSDQTHWRRSGSSRRWICAERRGRVRIGRVSAPYVATSPC